MLEPANLFDGWVVFSARHILGKGKTAAQRACQDQVTSSSKYAAQYKAAVALGADRQFDLSHALEFPFVNLRLCDSAKNGTG